MSQVRHDVKVLVVDDHAATRKFLRFLLQEHGLRVVGEAADGLEAVRQCEKLRPDIVVLDVSMPLLNGFEAARRIAAISPGCKIIFLTGHKLKEYVAEALRVGGVGFVLKDYAVHDLLAAIEAVSLGGTYVSRASAA